MVVVWLLKSLGDDRVGGNVFCTWADVHWGQWAGHSGLKSGPTKHLCAWSLSASAYLE